MSECKRKHCKGESFDLDKPYCSSICCIEDLESQLGKAREVIKSVDLYIEAECHEAWANNWEGREGAFVDMAIKLKQLRKQV